MDNPKVRVHEIFAGSNFREFRGFSIDWRKFDTAKIPCIQVTEFLLS